MSKSNRLFKAPSPLPKPTSPPDVRLHKFLIVGVYGVYVDGVLVDEMPTQQIPLLPGKRMSLEELDAAMRARLTPADIAQAINRPLF